MSCSVSPAVSLSGSWMRNLVALGLAAFNLTVIDKAVTGYVPVAPYKTRKVGVYLSGDAESPTVHFNRNCEMFKEDPVSTRRSNVLIDWVLESRRHVCRDCKPQVTSVLPEDVVNELSLLHDLRALTRPYRSAQFKSRSAGYTVTPEDSEPMTSGALNALVVRLEDASKVRGRKYLLGVSREVSRVIENWEEVRHGGDFDSTGDPHNAVISWQASLFLPKLQGSPAQVKWAETIRHKIGADSDSGAIDLMLQMETSARIWIGLRDLPLEEVAGDWTRMHNSPRHRSGW